MPSDLADQFLCLADFEPAARDRLPHAVYEFVAGAAGDEITMRDNVVAFDRLRIRPRVLRDVSKIDTSITIFGDKLSHPILLAPTSFQRMSHPEGEVASARGAGEAGSIFTLGTSGTATIEECVATSSGADLVPAVLAERSKFQSRRCGPGRCRRCEGDLRNGRYANDRRSAKTNASRVQNSRHARYALFQ